MHAWEAIQKTLDHIETHMAEEMEIEQLAATAALSPFYYQRLFSRLVKKPVREYIRLRRLARACEVLADKQYRILDIALEFGFGSHEAFTRTFKAAYGITPEAYRARPVMLNQFDKPDLLLSYAMVDEGVPLISEGLVTEFSRRALVHPVFFLGVTGVIPIRGQMPLGEATGIDLTGEVWSRFHREKIRIPRVPNGREVGVAYLEGAPKGSFTYFAGAEVADDTAAAGFTRWQLPPNKYVVCEFEAENFEQLVTVAINKAVKYSVFWLERHGLKTGGYSPEVYPANAGEVARMELWLPIEAE